MTVTADPRSSAPTAAGPPTSSYSSSDSSGAEAISPYGVALSDSPIGAGPARLAGPEAPSPRPLPRTGRTRLVVSPRLRSGRVLWRGRSTSSPVLSCSGA